MKQLNGYDRVRTYGLLAPEWPRNVRYLNDRHACPFSLAMRLNPFDPKASEMIDQ